MSVSCSLMWSPVRKGLTSWLSVLNVSLCFCHFPIWCPRSGMVLGCIDSWSFLSLQVSNFARNHDSTHRGGLERGYNPYNNLLQEDDHNISHKINSWPHRWTTTHLTGRISFTSKVDYDMTPRRMVTTYLNGNTAHPYFRNRLITCALNRTSLKWDETSFTKGT